MLRCRQSHQVSGTGHLCANEHGRSRLPGQGARGQRLLRLMAEPAVGTASLGL